jgi:FAD/FMN-containing dehydrogenase
MRFIRGLCLLGRCKAAPISALLSGRTIRNAKGIVGLAVHFRNVGINIMTTLLNDTTEKLKDNLKGRMVLPDNPGYNEARKIWNAMIDRRPAVIVQCAEADDLPHAIAFARANGLEISIRGVGHNIAGNAVCDNGVMIDLSTMTNVRVDTEKRRAYVEPGATLGDFDKAVQAHGLATPVGINSTTGIAGLTLGGGFGWLTRKYGMTIDNLVSAEVVTADGSKIRAGENENVDLFWAIRGGGGNFGVVTQFEYELHDRRGRRSRRSGLRGELRTPGTD